MSIIIAPVTLHDVLDASRCNDDASRQEKQDKSENLGDWGLVSPDRRSDQTPFDHLFQLDSETVEGPVSRRPVVWSLL